MSGGPPSQGPQHIPFHPSPSGGIYLANQPIPTPDPSITAKEDALVKVTRGRVFDIGTDRPTNVPGRPGYGTKGSPIVLRTNYLRITTASEAGRADMEQIWFKYDVEVSPQLSKPKTRRLFERFVTHPRFKDITWATDYAKIIVTTKEIDLQGPKWTQKVGLPPENTQVTGQIGPLPDFVRDAQARNTVTFAVQGVGSFTPSQLIDYLCSTSAGATYQGLGDIIQLFNIIMCKAPNTLANVMSAGRNRFYAHEPHPGKESYDLRAGLEALRGYFSSVRPAVGRLLLNLNVTSGAFFKPMSLILLLRESGRTGELAETFLHMLKVKAEYKKDMEQKPFMQKIKTIVGFAKELRPPTFRVKRMGNAREVTFRFTDRTKTPHRERETTVFDYFRDIHGITLKRPELPVLNTGTRSDPQYMPIELCTVLPGQQYRRLLSGDQTSEMLTFAARPPNLNAMSIIGTPQAPGNGMRMFRLLDQPKSVQPFGFRVGLEMLTVPGRVHNAPQVQYGSDKQMRPSGGSWNLANQKFAKPGRLGAWQALIINRQGNRGNALMPGRGDMLGPDALLSQLEKTVKGYGTILGAPVPAQTLTLDTLVPQNRDANNLKLVKAFEAAAKEGVRLLLVILPDVDRWLYSRIKYYGDIKFGIHTINAVGSKLQKTRGQEMYIGNLALKFNIKGGGVCHTIPSMFIKPLDKNTMLMGIDVTHPSPGSTEGAPSIACVVASIDEHLGQWPGSIRTQRGRQEMVEGLADMICERLQLWQRKNKRYPSKIILYRDGVSEGQYEMVLNDELPGIQGAFERIYGAEKNWPKLAIIVVGKRHHTRFYPTEQKNADYNAAKGKGSWNPLPGTVVDRHISGRILREFWLQAHQGLQGTARPAHYVVLKDDMQFEADELEIFTHNMCYLFNRATKAVSICPPAYYADLLCERGRFYLFSRLAEDNASVSSGGSNTTLEWTRDVHERLAESTWYI